jgi:hypothetical protein
MSSMIRMGKAGFAVSDVMNRTTERWPRMRAQPAIF